MPGRFDQILKNAAVLMEPEAQFIKVPYRTLKTEKEIEVWLQEVRELLKAALSKGSVIIT
jgi:hypothetical protein